MGFEDVRGGGVSDGIGCSDGVVGSGMVGRNILESRTERV